MAMICALSSIDPSCGRQVNFLVPINFSGKKVIGDIKVPVGVDESAGVEDLQCSTLYHQSVYDSE